MLEKPCVALFLYNKLNYEHLSATLNKIELLIPKKIFIFSDGPPEVTENFSNIFLLREFLKNYVFKTSHELIFHDSNIGLRRSVEMAADLIFLENESCIFIEDDIELFDNTLWFMDDCLNRFRDYKKIGHISGWNLSDKKISALEGAIYVDLFPASFIWATWCDRWALYETDLSYWRGLRGFIKLYKIIKNLRGALIWFLNVRAVDKNYLDSWAIFWTLSLWKNNIFSISSKFSFSSIKNIGAGTHTIFFSLTDKNSPIKINEPLSFVNPNVDQKVTNLKLKKIYKSHFYFIISRFFFDAHRERLRILKGNLWAGRDSNPEPTD